MAKPIDTITAHVIRTLPDSFGERREVVEALVEILPKSHPQRNEVVKLLWHLDMHTLLQRELPLVFTSDRGNHKGDGR